MVQESWDSSAEELAINTQRATIQQLDWKFPQTGFAAYLKAAYGPALDQGEQDLRKGAPRGEATQRAISDVASAVRDPVSFILRRIRNAVNNGQSGTDQQRGKAQAEYFQLRKILFPVVSALLAQHNQVIDARQTPNRTAANYVKSYAAECVGRVDPKRESQYNNPFLRPKEFRSDHLMRAQAALQLLAGAATSEDGLSDAVLKIMNDFKDRLKVATETWKRAGSPQSGYEKTAMALMAQNLLSANGILKGLTNPPPTAGGGPPTVRI